MELGWFEVSLDVKDIDRTRGFYEKLGFEVVGEAAEGRVVTLQKADCRICLYQGVLDPAETQLTFWQGTLRRCRLTHRMAARRHTNTSQRKITYATDYTRRCFPIFVRYPPRPFCNHARTKARTAEEDRRYDHRNRDHG